MSDYDQLVQASRLYYELGETQNAIAERLGVTRPQVSRLLKRARAEGIVEIRIIDKTTAESPAADALRRSYGLDAVHLAPTVAGPEDLTRRMVGRLAAQVLRADDPRRRDRRDRRWGVGRVPSPTPSTRRRRRSARRSCRWPAATGRPGPEREPFRRIADALGAQAHGLMAPGLLDDAATKHALEAHAGVRAVLDLWSRLDVALFGIGGRVVGCRVGRRGRGRGARTRRRGRRGPHRPVRPRWRVRLPGAARAGPRLRCAGARARPGRDRRGGGREQGPADPRARSGPASSARS